VSAWSFLIGCRASRTSPGCSTRTRGRRVAEIVKLQHGDGDEYALELDGIMAIIIV
jgi:hypothetical protein